ncbi:MAG: phosphoglucosamine mutase [Promethearchaeota archaeon]
MDSPFQRGLKFTTNGIRGIAEIDLTPISCKRIGRSIGMFLGKDARVLIGTDYRDSGPMIKRSLVSGLLDAGVNVEDAGFTPTPSIQKYVKDTKRYDMGLMVTASHNPPEFNGIKVVDFDGIEIAPYKEHQIEENYGVLLKNPSLPNPELMGNMKTLEGVTDHYMKQILENITINRDIARDIHVIVDPGNGIACSYIDKFLDKIGIIHTTIFGEPDGSFPNRVSEPTPDSLVALKEKVLEENASFGIGFDGDGDRAIFIDDRGEFHWGDESFAVILNDLLPTYKDWVVTPVSSSTLIQEIVQEHGAKLEWTKVGSITVSRRMLELDAIIAGEENGGIFYSPHQPVRDGGIALTLILEILGKRKETLSALFDELPKYHLHKKTIKVQHEDKQRVMNYIERVTKDEKTMVIDGIKIFKDGGSVLIRPSGTEPKFRSFADGKTKEIAKRLSEWGIKLVKEAL